jgi:hypothetical protein
MGKISQKRVQNLRAGGKQDASRGDDSTGRIGLDIQEFLKRFSAENGCRR